MEQKKVKVNYKKVFVAILNLFNRRGLLVPKVNEKFTEENFQELLKLVNLKQSFQGESFEEFVSQIQSLKRFKKDKIREVEND